MSSNEIAKNDASDGIAGLSSVGARAGNALHIMVGSSAGSGRSILNDAIALTATDDPNHLIVIGSKAEGRHQADVEQPASRGATDARGKLERARMHAIRRAYWDATKAVAPSYLDPIHDVLVTALGRAPSDSECEAFFMRLPAELLGEVIKWGLNDTVVREQMCEFAMGGEVDDDDGSVIDVSGE